VSFRRRISLIAAAAVAVAIVAASVSAYLIVGAEMRGQIDDSLRSIADRARALNPDGFGGAAAVAPAPAPRPPFGRRQGLALPPPEFGGAAGYLQVVTRNGRVIRPPRAGPGEIPPDATTLAVASGTEGTTLTDETVNGTHVRVLTEPLGRGVALQVARPLTEVDSVLGRLRWILLGVCAGGIALAAFLGLGVGRAGLRPLRALGETVDEIRATGDLRRQVPIEGDDELSRLGTRFNEMLAALSASLDAQRQLVADASHELRTPLTSLRTNIELLSRNGAVPERDRVRALSESRAQLAELSTLVGDVVELARSGETEAEVRDVRLDLLVEAAIARARRHHPLVRFDAELQASTVRAAPERLERAIANLLDNAAKWSPARGVVELAVSDGELVVRDHGPGIDEHDLPHVFDRFYRAPAARGTPGSGLGLAIVRQVAEAHGGSVSAERAQEGGTRLCLRLSAVS
jgi:two-component system, OmpR family, sensor histidine kinase MprB